MVVVHHTSINSMSTLIKICCILFVAVCTTYCGQPAPTPIAEVPLPAAQVDTHTQLPEAPLAKQKVVKKPDAVAAVTIEEMPIANIGRQVLEDSAFMLDNEVIIFKLLDSLGAEKRTTRDFYFSVFNRLIRRSDGILADAVGEYALRFVENYPAEFLANSKGFTNAHLETWASQIGIELYLMTGTAKSNFDRAVENFRKNCKGCGPVERERLTRFETLIWNTIEQNLNERVP